MRKSIFALFLISFTNALYAQTKGTDDNFYSLSLKNATSYYHHTRNINAEIYNGTEYLGYLFSIDGHAYFGNADWQTGTIIYNDIAYDSIQLKYDLLKDAVIIRHPNGYSMIALFSPRVQKFSFNGLDFMYINEAGNASLQPGFYQTLLTGKLTLLAKRIKKLDEKVQNLQVERKFIMSTNYYVFMDNSFHLIKKENDILNLVKDHKKEIQQHLKSNNLKFKHHPEKVLIAIAEFYNQINN